MKSALTVAQNKPLRLGRPRRCLGLPRGRLVDVQQRDHLEGGFGRAAVWAFPLARNVIPARARWQSMLRQALHLVIQESASEANEPSESICVHRFP
jgi:hypothetical protein